MEWKAVSKREGQFNRPCYSRRIDIYTSCLLLGIVSIMQGWSVKCKPGNYSVYCGTRAGRECARNEEECRAAPIMNQVLFEAT